MLSSPPPVSSTSSTPKLDNELSTYLSESLLPRHGNPLQWWSSNCHRFPTLAKIARIYLASPPTSVPSERVFSIAGGTLDDHRTRLLPANAERLILLKFNFRFFDHDMKV
jgi:hypothetical protein